MAGATRTITVDAPLEKVYAAVTDYDRYAEFSPEIRKLNVANRRGSEVDVHYEIDLVKTIRYSLRMREQPPNRLSWTFIEGQFMKDNRGGWTLEDLGGGKTRVVYEVEVALGPLVPKSLVNKLVDHNLPRMLEAFKRYVERP